MFYYPISKKYYEYVRKQKEKEQEKRRPRLHSVLLDTVPTIEVNKKM
jgi:hypothetical protein